MTYRPTNDPGAAGTPARAGPGGISWAWVLVAVLALAIVLLIGWWLWQGGGAPVQQLRSTSLGLILEEPAAHENERVVVSGRVERLLTDNAITLGSDLVEGEVLVLTPPGVMLDPAGGVAPGGVGGVAAPAGGVGGAGLFLEGQFVQITGTIRTFDSATLSEEFGLVLAPELFDPFEGEPAIITEVFDVAVQGAQIPPPVEPEVVDVGSVLAEPERYAGQAARVEGALGQVVSGDAFTLTAPEAEGELLVVGQGTGGFDEVEPGRAVRVEGTILAFDEEAVRQEAVGLEEGVDYSAFEGEPAILATVVEILESEPAAGSPPADETPAGETTPAAETAPAEGTGTAPTPSPAE